MAIVFLTHSTQSPTGGIKVVYQNVETLNENGYESEVLHTNNPEAVCEWLSYNIKSRKVLQVDPSKDFVVIPEGSAGHFGRMCQDLGVHYCIYVQNGYQLYNDEKQSTPAQLESVYWDCDLLLSISENSSSVLKYLYPDFGENKILRLYPSINERLFHTSPKNRKLISLMPRKLGVHARILLHLLNNHVPTDWEVCLIDGLNEFEVSNILRQTSIFISLSDLEGFGLPPLEAAFCGNVVVGYTGQGGLEYFDEPIFRKVENGNFLEFCNKICEAIKDVENGFLESLLYTRCLASLRAKYSQENYVAKLTKFASIAESIMGQKNL